MPVSSSTVGVGADESPCIDLTELHLRSAGFPAPTRVTVSAAIYDEDEAALELAALLARNGIRRPFLIASSYGRKMLRGVVGAVGSTGPGGGATQASARSTARAARRVGADAVVAAGGGRCLDVGKLAAAGAGLPCIAVPTQLSHDGICSPVSVLPRAAGGVTESVEAVAPRLAFFSTPRLLQSPFGALRAGIGDLISNPMALLDWELAAEAGLEQVDPVARGLSMEAYGLVEPLLDRPLRAEDVRPEVIGVLAHARAASGLAMTTMGTSRPASGAEHKISHAIDELFGGRAYHGEQVAFASLLSAALHGLDVEDLRRRLVNLGVANHPRQLRLSLDDMVQVLLRAPATRPGRFTVLEQASLDEVDSAALLRWVWPDL